VARESGPEEQQALMIDKRIQEIEKVLIGWQPKGEAAYEAWSFWRASDYACLPFAGGYLDQPAWIMDEFAMLNLTEEFFRLQYELQDLGKRLAQKGGRR
jgi:hypothetical protein